MKACEKWRRTHKGIVNPGEYNSLKANTLPFEPMRPMAKQRLDRLARTLAALAK